jgi:hypothetical protein
MLELPALHSVSHPLLRFLKIAQIGLNRRVTTQNHFLPLASPKKRPEAEPETELMGGNGHGRGNHRF